MHLFRTPQYQGAWFAFSGDREGLRSEIQSWLRVEFNDEPGRLEVREDGPHWVGSAPVQVSYSHTTGAAVAVASRSHRLGVDTENLARKFSQPPQEIARRYFHADEAEMLKTPADFLALWCKKEAYAKLTRAGIKNNLHKDLREVLALVQFNPIEVAPTGYTAFIALGTSLK